MKPKSIDGAAALISGSSRGIGKAVAERLAARGARVMLNGRNEEVLAEAVADLRRQGCDAEGAAGDVGTLDACRRIVMRTVERFGRLDILVNNAGISACGSVAETEPEVFQRLLTVNLVGPLLLSREALPHLRAAGGSIVFCSSIAGLAGLPGYAAYSLSKMPLTALRQNLAMENRDAGVFVGINYIGFTENEARKTMMSADGRSVPVPKRRVRTKSREAVARRIVRGIERRRPRQYFSVLAFLMRWSCALAPTLLERVIPRVMGRAADPR